MTDTHTGTSHTETPPDRPDTNDTARRSDRDGRTLRQITRDAIAMATDIPRAAMRVPEDTPEDTDETNDSDTTVTYGTTAVPGHTTKIKSIDTTVTVGGPADEPPADADETNDTTADAGTPGTVVSHDECPGIVTSTDTDETVDTYGLPIATGTMSSNKYDIHKVTLYNDDIDDSVTFKQGNFYDKDSEYKVTVPLKVARPKMQKRPNDFTGYDILVTTDDGGHYDGTISVSRTVGARNLKLKIRPN